jgi:hypothetical protein
MHVLSLMFAFRVNGATAFCARTRRQKQMSGGAEGSTVAASIPNPREVGPPDRELLAGSLPENAAVPAFR